ncbi:MAG: MFS transporter, partial [Verrucomicrobiota bacterium]|nr:MFS transporter [Verrucomicrobiota bacterium]
MIASPPSDPIPERILQRAMRLNVAAGCVGMFWGAVAFGMPLPLFMEAMNASGQQLGVVGAVRQVAMIFQIPAAFIVERMAARKPLWFVVALIHRLMWVIPALCPLIWPGRRDLYPIVTIVALGISDILANFGTAPWLSWMADLLPANESGRFWGSRQRLHSVCIVFASGLYGLLLDHFPAHAGLTGFAIVFAIAALGGMLDIVVHGFVYEPRPVPHPQREPWLRRVIAPLRDPQLRRLTWALGAWSCAIAMPGISNGLPSFFNVVYLKEAFGATYSQASLLFIASAVSAVAWTPWLGRLIDQWG